ncbi:tRNA (guanine(37)-N1)-methyltransferase [Rhynchospora pubera]|uniref:tRNA (guanine(37)-N1)-methyltransferase n=1 Tax=Rhynchospora pubera TaxID=906938 RepID=A0AAV8HM66_9POAL|nr:tRNA (guanine(37)-N1)-methyltransferase [Rhynchospora pubera]
MTSTFTLQTRLAFSPHRLLFRPFPFSSSKTLTVVACSNGLHHGPSLRHGHGHGHGSVPEPVPNLTEQSSIDRDIFTRVFDLAALRVPAAECSELERRLRGHLLNWPRIRNVARVMGDDVDPSISKLLSRNPESYSSDEEPQLSPVLHREKLIKQFNHRGFINFRNLAKISRPKKKKKRFNERNDDSTEKIETSSVYKVELVSKEDNAEDWSSLIGEEFNGGSWRGPTRLLLLDERYARTETHMLPGAVKALLYRENERGMNSLYELVHCRLTIFYSYWQMTELLEALLPEDIIVPSGFETIGHVAHLNLREEHLPYKKLIAQVVLDKNKPKIQTVVNKTDAIENEYRTMQLEVLAGNHSLVTTVIENGIRFQLDLATVYWNSRLATERQRLIASFTNSDVFCDVFAGVGPIAISAARKVRHVYANDLNPNAVEYLERNTVLNKLDRKIEVFNMDGRRFVGALFSSQQILPITQVVMNLPNDAAEFLDIFKGIFRNRSNDDDSCILPKIHVYGFSKAQNPEFDFHERINMALCETVREVEMHRVRLVAPGKWMLCASFNLPRAVAFGKPLIKVV